MSDHRALIEEARAEHEADEHGRCTHCMEWWVEFDSNGSPSRGQAITSAYPCMVARLADALEQAEKANQVLASNAYDAELRAEVAERWEEEHERD